MEFSHAKKFKGAATPPMKKESSLVDDYIDAVRKGIGSDEHLRVGHRIRTTGNTSVVDFNFFKGDTKIGAATRNLTQLGGGWGAELKTLVTTGRTGLVDPLYKAESSFFKEMNMVVKSNLVNEITERKFKQHYPSATHYGGGRWMARDGAAAASSMAEDLTSGAGKTVGKTKGALSTKAVLGALIKSVR